MDFNFVKDLSYEELKKLEEVLNKNMTEKRREIRAEKRLELINLIGQVNSLLNDWFFELEVYGYEYGTIQVSEITNVVDS